MFQGHDVEWNIRHRVNQLKKERKKKRQKDTELFRPEPSSRVGHGGLLCVFKFECN